MECPVKQFPHLSTLESSKTVEFPNPVFGVVSGIIPNWLNGSWYRNGPGILHFREESVKHWFDGMALARRFHIHKGKATYISRLVEGESLQKNTKAGRVVVAEFGTSIQATDEGFLNKMKKFLTLPEFTDNCLINFVSIGGYLFAMTESNFIQKMDPKTLDTQEKVDLSAYLPINIMSSHPLQDGDDSVYTFSSSILGMGRTKYNLLKFPSVKKGTSLEDALSQSQALCSIDSAWLVSPSYHHSFAMSENYAIFVEMPLKIDIPKMSVAHLRHMCYSDCLETLPDKQTRIYLVHKRTGERCPITYKTEPLIVYHHINAYEKNGYVVLDLCCYEKNSYYNKFTMENLSLSPVEYEKKFSSDELVVCAKRIVMPLAEHMNKESSNLISMEGTACIAKMTKENRVFCQSELIVKGTEVPVINNNYLGKKYQYYYSAGGRVLPPGEMLAKIDVDQKTIALTWKERGCWASQPVFVQRPRANSEDDGVLMSSVTSESGKPFLLILDATNFDEVGRVHFDANIPPDIHGIFVPELESD